MSYLSNNSTIRRRRRIVLLAAMWKISHINKRRVWVRNIFTEQYRKEQGAHDNLIAEMRLTDTDNFVNYLRMSPTQFAELLSIVGPHIAKLHLNREPISTSTRLALTLRYLASGDSMVSLSYAFRVGKSTASGIIADTCGAIWNTLNAIVLKEPDETDWKNIAREFKQTWNFPNCIGALDGKHIVIQALPNSGSAYYNYKGHHSIVLMAIADSNCRFIAVDIGGQGRHSDGGIFRNSNMGQRLETNDMKVPPHQKISSTSSNMPFVLVADEAFALKNYIMRPYPKGSLTVQQKVFNYRLSRARRTVESAFGILAARWRIFGKPIIASLSTITLIVQACICLHNWLKPNIDGGYDGSKSEKNLFQEISQAGTNTHSRAAAAIRNNFPSFFCEEGAVDWQWEKIQTNNY